MVKSRIIAVKLLHFQKKFKSWEEARKRFVVAKEFIFAKDNDATPNLDPSTFRI